MCKETFEITDMEKYNFDKRYVMSEKGYVEFGEQFHSCPIEFDQHLALADMTIPIPGIGIGITETISV